MEAEIEAAGLLEIGLCTSSKPVSLPQVIVDLCMICGKDYRDGKYIDCSKCKKSPL